MYANIANGTHRGNEVNGIFKVEKVFDAKKQWMNIYAEPNTFGNTVPTPRIRLNEEQFFYCDKDGNKVDLEELQRTNPMAQKAIPADNTDHEADFYAQESDQDAMSRIASTFGILNEVTEACHEGIVKGLVVSGPPGIGKSYGVEATLNEANMFRTIAGNQAHFDVISGAATPIALYKKLYDNRHKGFVTVFDDCDNILFDEVSINLLKAALDSKPRRSLCWLAESRALKEADIPDKFEFEGSVIFLTNIDFERTTASKIKDHLAAIISRCHYLDLAISTQRDQVLRIKQIVGAGMLSKYDFKNGEENTILNYIDSNANYVRELSLRMVIKIADLVKSKPHDWERLCEATCLRRDARFKRLAETQVN